MIAIDLFAGGGGASEGIRRATGVEPIIAINHCRAAIDMHAANHPRTIHLHESVWDVHAQDFGGEVVDLLWASPDCTHFSRAKGAAPRSKEIRSLAWVIVDWAHVARPAVICMENVPEFVTWGPLLEDTGQPDKTRAGETFRQFINGLESAGYVVEWRVLNAADYGAPTSRRRLFLVARCDGEAIGWPEPTHGPGRALPWRTAAECIDWSLPVPSIFDRKRPLAEATQRRIAEGIRRYVLTSASPYLLCLTHGGRLEPLGEPMRTTTAHRGERALVAPILARAHSHGWDANGSDVRAVDRPGWTVTAKDGGALVAATLATLTSTPEGGDRLLVVPNLINTRNGERAGQTPRALDITRPMPTVTGQGSQGALIAAFLARYNSERPGAQGHVHDLDQPLPVVPTENRFGLIAAFLARHNGGPNGHPSYGRDLRETMGTVTGRDTQALAAVWLDKLHGSARAGQPLDLPAPTVTSGGGRGGGHAALCAAFLLKYYGQGGQWSGLDEPMHTLVSKARMGLVTVTIQGEEYALVDIGMRMLQPRELAHAQGFPDSYILTGNKSEQVARIGNSVCPPVAEALVRAQFPGAARGAA